MRTNWDERKKQKIKPGPYWYLEPYGIPLTWEIIGKSVLVVLLALATCIPVCLIVDRGKRLLSKKQQEKKQRDKEILL